MEASSSSSKTFLPWPEGVRDGVSKVAKRARTSNNAKCSEADEASKVGHAASVAKTMLTRGLGSTNNSRAQQLLRELEGTEGLRQATSCLDGMVDGLLRNCATGENDALPAEPNKYDLYFLIRLIQH